MKRTPFYRRAKAAVANSERWRRHVGSSPWPVHVGTLDGRVFWGRTTEEAEFKRGRHERRGGAS